MRRTAAGPFRRTLSALSRYSAPSNAKNQKPLPNWRDSPIGKRNQEIQKSACALIARSRSHWSRLRRRGVGALGLRPDAQSDARRDGQDEPVR